MGTKNFHIQMSSISREIFSKNKGKKKTFTAIQKLKELCTNAPALQKGEQSLQEEGHSHQLKIPSTQRGEH